MKNKFGIFGGTFNPIHLGHLIVAKEAKNILKLDKIIFIPSALPPHKNAKEIACIEHRLEMIKLALKKENDFTFSTIEMERPGKSYTIETLRQLNKIHPDTDFFFLIGADNLKEIQYWKEPENILKYTNIVILNRPKYENFYKEYKNYFDFLSDKKLLKKIKIISVSNINISSTDIRNKVKEKKPIDNLVPEKVKEYILKHELY